MTLSRCIAFAFFALLLSLHAFAGQKEDIQAAMQAQEWAKADELLQTSLAAHPRNSLAHYWRAQVQAKLGRMQVAADELAAARRIDPEQKFASNPQALARLEADINAAAEPKIVAPEPTTSSTESAPAPIQRHPEPKPQPRTLYFTIAVGAITAIGLLIYLTGAAKRRARREEVAQSISALQEAKQLLEDARLWSDGNAALSPEQKLGNYDRVNKLKGEISTLAATLKAAPALEAVLALVARAEDEAADIRGLEKPSAVRARLAEAAAQRQFDVDMERARRAPIATAAAHSGSLDPASALYLGAMLNNGSWPYEEGSRARHANADAGYDATPLSIPEFENKPSFGIDIGGSSAGDMSFDAGGSSGGGGDTSF